MNGREKYFLITTADMRTWKQGEKCLFLGNWCFSYANAIKRQPDDAKTCAYHWDDRKKLHRDYLYLKDLYETILSETAGRLNSFHGANHSIHFWRILVGPWLLYFVQMVFDRWEMIQFATNNYNISNTFIYSNLDKFMIPTGMKHFRQLYFTDRWNHFIYGEIIRRWTSIPHSAMEVDDAVTFPVNEPIRSKNSYKQKARTAVTKILKCFSRRTDSFIISSYLSPRNEILLKLKLRETPRFEVELEIPQFSMPQTKKDRLGLTNNGNTGFEQCIRTLVSENIPGIYLEGYGELEKQVLKLDWPKKPKFIFTASNYNADDTFKLWAAGMREKGTPLIIGQHGGNLGTALWTSSEDHETAIADRYLTWGWHGTNKQYPVVGLKAVGRKDQPWNAKGRLILISSVVPKYSYVMGSFTVAAHQTEQNLQDQFDFVKYLSPEIKDRTVIRLFKPDWNWLQAEQWQEQHPSISVDNGSIPLQKLQNTCRLNVTTYNATTLLESLSDNFPTIAFWRPEHWELRPQAVPFFDLLQSVGILHYTPAAAATQAQTIWDDVRKWWLSSPVQDARRIFCDHYNRKIENGLDILKDALLTTKIQDQMKVGTYGK